MCTVASMPCVGLPVCTFDFEIRIISRGPRKRIWLDPEFPGGRDFGSEFFSISSQPDNGWGEFMLQSWCGPRKSANFDHGRRREIFLPGQGTFFTLAGNSSVGTGMFLSTIGFMQSIYEAAHQRRNPQWPQPR